MDIIEKAERHVFHLFKDKLSPDYIYHNFNHTLRVVNAVKEISQGEKISPEDSRLLLLAAWFHDTGYVEGAQDHETRSSEKARVFLTAEGFNAKEIAKVQRLIEATRMYCEPGDTLENIIKDADNAHFADPNYIQLSELLREEWKKLEGKDFTDLEWIVANRMLLLHKHRYYTQYAKEVLQPKKNANIAALQEAIYEVTEKSKKEKKKNKKAKSERPDRGIDTMFRVTLSNHTRLSDIADSKANILLSVNAIIISIALSTLIPKLDSPTNTHLITPTFILMAFSTVSIVFAILSTRPKVNSAVFTPQDIKDRKINLLFFGNFYKMQLDEYDAAVKEIMESRDYVYSSLIKDLYYLGLVLHRKYKLLRITYNIFMIEIIVSVLAFAYAFWTL
ncbi:Pycsar system effector family protein [Flavobacterium rhizosphaerae]|uniref:Pycsar system effector family protein n=1 Tax=Flavobacterium rhizosphaerae TaxID=3163298 RepID=A0ABW8YRR9_9FLAO